ncbi:hypothetical protein BaRGS_00035434 [Batillaria attramentaria]|uniref:RING-type E3 ubiquitin transferase n=1 Tax=Batillaria attramentaria TaxID=370345 RepID=A0ABD0JEH6_9CAEN
MTTRVGTRVLRGPDWDAGDVDGGEGFLGTVTELLSNQKVRVQWDNGEESTCRTGSDGKFDLRVFDTAPVGVRHPSSKCDACGEEDIFGTLWRCRECTGCDLCTPCYSDDKHDLRHPFLRIDSAGDEGCAVPKRKTSVRVRAIGIFPGATVTRGKDWVWDDQDGGPGSEGEVTSYENASVDSSRCLVNVQWSSGLCNSYRLGFQGRVDLKFVEEEVGPFYYRDHLPVVDTSCTKLTDQSTGSTSLDSDNLTAILQGLATASSATSIRCAPPQPTATTDTTATEAATDDGDTASGEIQSEPPSLEDGAGAMQGRTIEDDDSWSEELSVGDMATVRVGEDKLKELQSDFGGCTARMVRCIGRTGEVTAISDTGAVSMKFGSTSKVKYRFNPVALMKVKKIDAGDVVRIKPDEEQVKLFNTRVGWKPEMAATLNKVGKVIKVDQDGDLLVKFNGCHYLYSPACCTLAPGATVDTVAAGSPQTGDTTKDSGVTSPGASEEKGDKQNMALFRMVRDMVIGDSAGSKSQGRTSMRALFGAIEMGDDSAVREMCQKDGTMLEREVEDLTPLIYATLRGKRSCVEALLELGADVNKASSNDHRKTPMSAALEGKDVTLAELLLERGADTTHVYNFGHTAAHIAVLRDQPFVIRALAKHGADMNAKDQFGDTPLHMAIERKKDAAMEALVSLPEVDLDIGDKRDFSAMQLTCYHNNPHALECILARDKSGTGRRRKGHSTALHIAATNDNVECVRLLIFNGEADINVRDNSQMTALHLACHRAKLQTVEALLELGADVNVADEDGDTPLHLCIGGKIEGYGKTEKAEVEVACRVQIANMLISRGAYVDVEDRKGRNPFSFGHTRVREGIKAFMRSNKGIVQTKSGAKVVDAIESLGRGKSRAELKEALKGVVLPCGVCGTPRSDVTLQPCQHRSVCSTCMDKVKQCPLCEEQVTEKIITGPDPYVTMAYLGFRVMRGPDWDAGDCDGGEGHLGILRELLSNQKVLVLWDTGQECTCRAGTDGKFDLRIFDTAQAGVRHPNTKCAVCGEVNFYGMAWRCKECTSCVLCSSCYNEDKHNLRHQFLRLDTYKSDGYGNLDKKRPT